MECAPRQIRTLNALGEVKALFDSAKAEEYLGEDITLVEHMIACAELAKKEKAPSWLVVAALLHDIGHILVPDAATAQDSGIDLHHDKVGAEWIARRFTNNIVQAVRLHVDAKKYLVAKDERYFNRLSEASKKTLAIQGGIFTQKEAEDFIGLPYAREAVQLRMWDDLGKIRGTIKSSISDYAEEIEECAL